MSHPDFDLIILGAETEACLAAVAARRAGARTALVLAPAAMAGGLLTEGGLAFVDRDARHLVPPAASPHDGLFGTFLARAGVPLVALDATRGAATLEAMLAEAGVTVVRAAWRGVRTEGRRLVALTLADGTELAGRFFLDATADADLAERAGMPFAAGFAEYGLTGFLGFSPLPVVHGVSRETIMETCRRLERDPELEALRERHFGGRTFLDLMAGEDYVLIGPPHLGLAYQRWREAAGLPFPCRFEADGFNVAMLGPETSSWNGLMYFTADLASLLEWSRGGTDEVFAAEARHFARFLHEALGWSTAEVRMPRGMYVRQTRHALDVAHRLSLETLARSGPDAGVGTFCYYPDFRGFRALALPAPLTVPVMPGAGIANSWDNLALATRSGGYTPFAHAICRLVQYNVTLGVALAVAAARARRSFADLTVPELRAELARLDLLAADPGGFDRNPPVWLALEQDPVVRLEAV